MYWCHSNDRAGAGSDLQGVRTNAKKDGSDWILNGSKTFITNGWLSDVVIVVTVTNREARSLPMALAFSGGKWNERIYQGTEAT